MAVSFSTRLGEVVDTSTSGFWAESDTLHVHPPIGALVSAPTPDGSLSYGIVSFSQTGGLDPGRRAIRRGGDDMADQAIYDRHPELEFVLRTLFKVTCVGYSSGARVRHTLPPLSVPLHYSVHTCDQATVQAFVMNPRYFPSLLRQQGEIAPEDLIAAHVSWCDETLDDGHLWLADATRRLAGLMKRDYDRLVVILNSIDPD